MKLDNHKMIARVIKRLHTFDYRETIGAFIPRNFPHPAVFAPTVPKIGHN